MNKLARGLLSLNLAGAIRLARFGLSDARERLRAAYFQIDPFGEDRRAVARAMERIPALPLSRLVRGRPIIKVDPDYVYYDGGLPWHDLRSLLALVVDRAPAVVLEVGTFNGFTTRLMAPNAPTATIHTVDLPEGYDPASGASPMEKDDHHLIGSRKVGAFYRDDSSITNVVQHYGDTATWDFGRAEGATFYFIDGSHTYEYARSDREKALAAARGRDATLLWHDCDLTHPAVVRWLGEMVDAGHPVKRVNGTNLAILDVPAQPPAPVGG
jgi:Methyltransferase domain